ncbi:hypothetical protein G7054_g5014 [Neopestalotiopsis clavispora]|nr:hypothetical protein G7054_g5014 [Neopestalotiopsis clavispora]
MGIKGLLRVLPGLPVGTTRVSLHGKSVVIDGPALVYRLWEVLMQSSDTTSVILGEVTYLRLFQTVVDWLEDLRSQAVHVRKIYFDGYLPPYKWETRKTRLMQQTQIVQDLSKIYRQGVEPLKDGQRPEPSRISNLKFSSRTKHHLERLPKHSFMIPAVIEHLRQSAWADVVQVVPGEADAYCAQDVRQNGGLLLTADSDLLLQDLGPDGAVVFLWDLFDPDVKKPDTWKANMPIDPASAFASKYYVATTYCPAEIERYFDISDRGGMPKLIFEWQQRGGSLPEAQVRMLAQADNEADNQAWDAFFDEHRFVEYVPDAHPVLDILSELDPRISEFIIQSLDLKVSGQRRASELTAKASKRAPRGSDELSIFLPVMLEDTSLKSCWEHSQVTRQLAYSLAQVLTQEQRESIIEYRTLLSTNGGRKLDIPKADITDSWCLSLISTLSHLEPTSRSADPTTKWLTFALYQEIQHAREAGTDSLTIKCATEAVYKEKPHDYSWQRIHLSAIIQASLYSLRILKQVLGVRASLTPAEMTKTQKTLLKQLEAMPPITEWPGIISLHDDLYVFGKGKGLAAIADILGAPKITLREPSSSKKKRPRASSRSDKRGTPSKMVKSTNPFDALEMASD